MNARGRIALKPLVRNFHSSIGHVPAAEVRPEYVLTCRRRFLGVRSVCPWKIRNRHYRHPSSKKIKNEGPLAPRKCFFLRRLIGKNAMKGRRATVELINLLFEERKPQIRLPANRAPKSTPNWINFLIMYPRCATTTEHGLSK